MKTEYLIEYVEQRKLMKFLPFALVIGFGLPSIGLYDSMYEFYSLMQNCWHIKGKEINYMKK